MFKGGGGDFTQMFEYGPAGSGGDGGRLDRCAAPRVGSTGMKESTVAGRDR